MSDHSSHPDSAPPEVGTALERLTDPAADLRARAGALRALTSELVRSGRGAGRPARWLADALLDLAPRLTVRDYDTLQRAHPGLDREELADALVATAAKLTSAIGAAGGAVAAVEWVAPPALLSVPVQLAAETLAVAAIETRLLGELHEVYGEVPAAAGARRMIAYVGAWAQRRGVDPLDGGSLGAVLGGAAKRQLRHRLIGRLGRNLTTLGPLLTGAAAGSLINGRETRNLAAKVRQDLRRRTPG